MANITGTAGNDSLDGTTGDDWIDGGAGDDILRGRAGNDILIGGDGDDQAYGEDGSDRFIGGRGNDTYVGGTDSFVDLVSYENAAAGVVVDLSLSMDQARSSGSVDAAAIGVDQLIGISDVRGSRYADVIIGDAGANGFYGAEGNDNLSGGEGSDVLEGGGGDDFLNGGAGEDAASYSRSAVGVTVSLSIVGPQVTGAGSDALVDIERLYGSTHDDVLTGSSGNNVLSGAAGADTMSGGDGNDTYYVDNLGDQVFEGSASGGNDRVFSSVSFGLWPNLESLTLTGSAAINGTGNALDNSIIGNSAANVINGGAGADTMSGGLGNDTYYVDNTGDLAIESSASGGNDRVFSSVSFGMWPNLENLTLTGSAAINGSGNVLNNSITGNGSANVINGGAGADTMSGGLGNDTYYIDNTGDLAIESSASGGNDRVFSSISFSLWPNLESLTLTGSASINGIGNALDNIITGNSYHNVLFGGAGADTMSGGFGNDTYYVDDVGDYVYEIPQTVQNIPTPGLDRVFSSISLTLWDNVEYLTLTGSAAINGTGNSADNIITGNSGNNVLDGAAGYDTMSGGDGDDTYYCDTADSVFEASATGGTDQIFSSVSFRLPSNVEDLTLTGTGRDNGYGNNSNNIITGNSLDNRLYGYDVYNSEAGEDDALYGGDGIDSLYGGTGNDVLSGGTGGDYFEFNTALDAAANVDRIVDFSVDDRIVLSKTIFSEITSTGRLSPDEFRADTVAQDADDRIIYDSATGNIYYDADGNGIGAQVLFAQVSPGTALTNAHFVFEGYGW